MSDIYLFPGGSRAVHDTVGVGSRSGVCRRHLIEDSYLIAQNIDIRVFTICNQPVWLIVGVGLTSTDWRSSLGAGYHSGRTNKPSLVSSSRFRECYRIAESVPFPGPPCLWMLSSRMFPFPYGTRKQYTV